MSTPEQYKQPRIGRGSDTVSLLQKQLANATKRADEAEAKARDNGNLYLEVCRERDALKGQAEQLRKERDQWANESNRWKGLANLKDAKGEANRTENNNLRQQVGSLTARVRELEAEKEMQIQYTGRAADKLAEVSASLAAARAALKLTADECGKAVLDLAAAREDRERLENEKAQFWKAHAAESSMGVVGLDDARAHGDE